MWLIITQWFAFRLILTSDESRTLRSTYDITTMLHLCVICQNKSFQSLAELSLKLHPTVEFGDTSNTPAKDWATNTYYLHYSTRQQLQESKITCHLCAPLSESLHIESIVRPNFLDCDPQQIFLTLKSGIPHANDPKLAEHIITVWAGQDSGDVLAKVYQQGRPIDAASFSRCETLTSP